MNRGVCPVKLDSLPKGGSVGAPRIPDQTMDWFAAGAGRVGRPTHAARADLQARARAGRGVRHRVPDGRARRGAGAIVRGPAAARPRRARVRSRRSGRSGPRGTGHDYRAGRSPGGQTGAARAHAARAGSPPLRPRVKPRHRGTGVRGVAGAPAPRADRDADGLVAGQALLGLSISHRPRRRCGPPRRSSSRRPGPASCAIC